MTYAYFKGYKAVYDYDRHDWFYEDTGESATKNPRPCKRCGHHSVKDDELEYDKALNDFNHLVEKYIYLTPNSISPVIFTEDRTCKVINTNNKVSEIQKERLLQIIQEKINEELDKYFKNGEVN